MLYRLDVDKIYLVNHWTANVKKRFNICEVCTDTIQSPDISVSQARIKPS